MISSLGPGDAGATSWVLVAAALVLLMTPGVAFFYGGMVRQKNVLGTVMQSFSIIGIVGLVWTLIGFSLVFGEGSIFGDLRFAGLVDLSAPVPGFKNLGVPLLAFAAFQMMVATFTPAVVTGATAERWRFASFALFVTLWSLLVYAPVAHWLFSPVGWARQIGALDFAGGMVIHVNAGAAGLVMAIVVGRRQGWPDEQHRPHNLPLALVGTALLWFGWFGLNGGAALRADGVAAVAVYNTGLAAAVGMLAWIVVERIRFGKPTALGAASGAITGLVAITPAAGYVAPWGAIVIGLLAGSLCQLAISLKERLRVDDSLDVFAVHLVGGAIGSISVGLFASRGINPNGADGLCYGGGFMLLGAQVIAVLAVMTYSLLLTILLGTTVHRLAPSRVRPRAEAAGLDLSQHGEAAYDLVASAPPAAAGDAGAARGTKPAGKPAALSVPSTIHR